MMQATMPMAFLYLSKKVLFIRKNEFAIRLRIYKDFLYFCLKMIVNDYQK